MSNGEPVYAVLNPRGIIPEREIRPLSPRLNTLEGKKVYVIYTTAGNPNDMKSIADDLQAAVPGCSVIYRTKLWGTWQHNFPWTADELNDITTNADAVVIGPNF